jgi:predicted CXXCH cytochrome family protein
MIRILTAAALSFALATSALAVEAPSKVLVLKAKSGDISFQHAKHKALKCETCHGAKPGKIPSMGKEKGHTTCLDCHKKEGKGPAKCSDCHKKA